MTTPTVTEGVAWYDRPGSGDEAAAAEASAAFRAAYGRDPEGVWAAPGRVNVIGEHVDYNRGLCLPFALPQRTYVALARRPDTTLAVSSAQGAQPWRGDLDQVAPGTVPGWAGYAVGVPWALQQAGYPVPHGFEAAVVGRVPLGAGLSSSAALECAVAVALDEVYGFALAGTDAGRARLAEACVQAENRIAGAPTGGLDQAASLRSRAGSALLLDCTTFDVRHVPFDCARAGLALLVMDTRVHHALVDGQYGSRRAACEQAADLLGVPALGVIELNRLDAAVAQLRERIRDPQHAAQVVRRVRHVVTEIARVREVAATLEGPAGLRAIGPLLDASHASLRDDYEVSSPELDAACSTARAAGALGARMTGGGFGGSAIALVEADAAGEVAAAVAARFAAAGFDPPAFLRAVPSAPAGRVT